MDIGTITVLIVFAMAGLLMLGVPLAFVSGAIAVVLAVSQFGLNALFIVGSRTADFLDSFALIAVPMFVIMVVSDALDRQPRRIRRSGARDHRPALLRLARF